MLPMKILMGENYSRFWDRILYNDVHWQSGGKVFPRFQEGYPTITELLHNISDLPLRLKYFWRLLDIAFFTDRTDNQNGLNTELNGETYPSFKWLVPLIVSEENRLYGRLSSWKVR
jgi:hypothetical protein